ncbi:MAG: FIST C-terminal domain-containing protein [Chloroflexota bacterium]|nr:FIST C-terminal domain-containing protein [Chloroflexota bacterium]
MDVRTSSQRHAGLSPRFGAGLSTRTDAGAAADEAASAAIAALRGSRADLAFVFASPQFEPRYSELLALIEDAVEGAVVIGCAAEGVIGPSREVEGAPAVAVWAASLPATRVAPFRLTFQEEAEHVVIDGLDELPGAAERPAMVMLADPFSFPADILLGHLNERAPGMPVVGGMASGGLEAGRNSLFLGRAVLRDGAVGAVLSGPHDISPIVSQGCRPVGATFAVTRAERNIVFELGGMPALRRIEELVVEAGERDQVLMRRGLHVGQAISELKPELGRGDFLIRNVIGVDQASGAIAISDMVEVGQTLQFQVRDAESAREDLRLVLENERQRDPAEVAGALLFSCNGRGQTLFGQPDHDIGALRRTFGDVPVAGFFAAGEMGPVGGKNFLHGFTASVLLFRPSGAGT